MRSPIWRSKLSMYAITKFLLILETQRNSCNIFLVYEREGGMCAKKFCRGVKLFGKLCDVRKARITTDSRIKKWFFVIFGLKNYGFIALLRYSYCKLRFLDYFLKKVYDILSSFRPTGILSSMHFAKPLSTSFKIKQY